MIFRFFFFWVKPGSHFQSYLRFVGIVLTLKSSWYSNSLTDKSRSLLRQPSMWSWLTTKHRRHRPSRPHHWPDTRWHHHRVESRRCVTQKSLPGKVHVVHLHVLVEAHLRWSGSFCVYNRQWFHGSHFTEREPSRIEGNSSSPIWMSVLCGSRILSLNPRVWVSSRQSRCQVKSQVKSIIYNEPAFTCLEILLSYPRCTHGST